MKHEIHYDVLTKDIKKLLKKLRDFKKGFYLGGGTSFSMQLGHRISIDLDFFSPEPIKKTLLKKVEETFNKSKILVLENSVSELTLNVDNVKFTFLHYPFPILEKLVETDEMFLMAALEILVTKAYTIGRRDAIKDYVDLYFGLKSKISSLSKIIELANKKYGEAFNDTLFFKQLLFVEDLEDDEVIMLNEKMPTRREMLEFFEEQIRELVNS